MIFKTYFSDTLKLLTLPETGMGYQLIEGKILSEDKIRQYVVYNCELAVNLDEDFPIYRKKIIERGFSTVLNESNSLLINTESIKIITGKPLFEVKSLSTYKQSKNKRHSGGKGAKENPKEYSDGNETFVRVSAYENDKRIDFKRKRLTEGSYTTTLIDYYDCITTDDDPVDRYALPNDEPIRWAFYIKPKIQDVLQRGIVQPAFGHEGGGIEVFFEKGTSDNTFFLQKEYGVL